MNNKKNAILVGQTFRYLVATVISAGLSISLPIVFHEVFAIAEEAAVGISLSLVFFVNFFTVRIFVFRSDGTVLRQLVRFAGLTAAFRLGEYLSFLYLFRMIGMDYIPALVLVLGLSFLAKFFLQRVFVFT